MKYRPAKPYSAPPFALVHAALDSDVVTLPVPGFRQARNYSCGFAAALMVLRHFGSELQGLALFEALGTERDGTGQGAIIRVLRGEGLKARVRYDLNFACLRACIDSGKVLIAYLDDEEHWIVLYGYGLSPYRVFVADPEPDKTCEHSWEIYGPRLGGFGIVCAPTAPTEATRDNDVRGQISFAFGVDS